jgi:hypothetical protein
MADVVDNERVFDVKRAEFGGYTLEGVPWWINE